MRVLGLSRNGVKPCKNKNSNQNFNWNRDRKTADSVSQRFSKFLAFYWGLNHLSFLENDAWVHVYDCSISKSSWLNCIFNKNVVCFCLHNYKIAKASILLPPGLNHARTGTSVKIKSPWILKRSKKSHNRLWFCGHNKIKKHTDSSWTLNTILSIIICYSTCQQMNLVLIWKWKINIVVTMRFYLMNEKRWCDN